MGIAIFVFSCTEMGKYFHFRAEHCQKYPLYRKVVQIKVVHKLIFYKKPRGRICLSPIGVEAGAPKIDMFVIL